MSHLFFVKDAPSYKMNLARHARQLFPLVLGNSRTALAAATRPLSTTPALSKEELDIKLDENPFYQKYADKIAKLKESNPAEYFKRIEAIKKASEKKQKPAGDSLTQESESHPVSSSSKPKADSMKSKGLDAIMKMELLEHRTASEIAELWKSYYKDKDAVYAIIPTKTFQSLYALSQANPIFLYPLPRKDGYEMFLGQFSGNDCHFTSLIQYQRFQENAPIQLAVNHYTELQESKGIVLMSGPVTGNGISVMDAQLLSYQMQYFYNEENYQIVKDFNKSPKNFDYNRIIECISTKLLSKQAGITET